MRFRNLGHRPDGSGRRIRRLLCNSLGNPLLKRAARTWLKGHRHKAREDIERRGERSGRSLRTKERRQGVRRFHAGAGGDNIVDRLLKFDAGTLDTLQIIAEGPGYGLFDGIGFWWHT